MIRRALISVFDKTALDEFAAGLVELGVELVGSGGTAAYIAELGLPVTPVDELTDVPELLGGRVKTLHPRIHAAILARRDRDDDAAALDEHEIEPFDLVCVNLYPFLEVATRYGTREHAAVARWFADREAFPEVFTPVFTKVQDLAYGENPHQRAAYYEEAGARRHLLSRVDQLHGKDLSFNNLADLSAGRACAAEFTLACCVIVKHGNPCGVAVAATIEEAYERALACDPLSAYGGVVVLNRRVGPELGGRIAEQFVEVLLAPGFDDAALDALRAKLGTRILADTERRQTNPGERDYRRVLGGMLVQDRDADVDDRAGMSVVCGSPSEGDWGNLLFAWRVCKHVTSNAIVLAKGLATIGVGAGQQSRVDAVRLALEKARDRGHDLHGAVLASDAFFPFADGPELALDAGIAAIIQPGGSKRDDEVIAAVDDPGAAMILPSRRHLRH